MSEYIPMRKHKIRLYVIAGLAVAGGVFIGTYIVAISPKVQQTAIQHEDMRQAREESGDTLRPIPANTRKHPDETQLGEGRERQLNIDDLETLPDQQTYDLPEELQAQDDHNIERGELGPGLLTRYGVPRKNEEVMVYDVWGAERTIRGETYSLHVGSDATGTHGVVFIHFEPSKTKGMDGKWVRLDTDEPSGHIRIESTEDGNQFTLVAENGNTYLLNVSKETLKKL
jgi:hypothetical protein